MLEELKVRERQFEKFKRMINREKGQKLIIPQQAGVEVAGGGMARQGSPTAIAAVAQQSFSSLTYQRTMTTSPNPRKRLESRSPSLTKMNLDSKTLTW